MKINIEQVLTVAADEFAEHGFDAMSMRALAQKCGMSAPALYYHFSSKEELYLEVFNRLQDTIIADIDRALAGVAEPEQRIDVYISTLFDAWANGPLQLLTQRDAIQASINPEQALAQAYYQRLLSHAQEIFRIEVKTAINPRAAYGFASLLFGYVSLLPYEQRESGLDKATHREQRKCELISICQQRLRVRAGT